jgi:phosphoribosylaminoimidazolecarboxamide formyltransferase/IMP cyclohydrolase
VHATTDEAEVSSSPTKPTDAPDLVRVRRALISVSDKTGLTELAGALAASGVEILSTGGSARAIRDAGIPVTEVAAHTGFPEIMDGRVKTLHPSIHGGILARRDLAEHRSAMEDHGIAPIDLVAVNLYPFEETLASGADRATCIENIDIGGPAMLRAAAKNHAFVTVVCEPGDYTAVIAELKANEGATTQALRTRLAAAAYAHTAAYDAAISGWMLGAMEPTFPAHVAFGGRLRQTLRYGENPHQRAALYLGGPARAGVANARQVQGKELSYNNLNDTDAAFELAAEFQAPAFARPAVAIIKHANPCGVALGGTLAEAYRKALACDPVSAFGGIIALNRPLDAETAAEIAKIFTEVIIAPGLEPAAREILAEKKNLRMLVTEGLPDPSAPGMLAKTIAGGLLLQSRDTGRVGREDLKVVTKRAPSEQEMDDMLFAFRVAKHVKSNTIVLARDGATIGIGAGQMSRVDSARIAAWKARDAAAAAGASGEAATAGCVGASDAFFPFADGLVAVIEAGARAVIQPGGSMRDDEVIAAADEAGIAMVFTGMRHFRH